MGTKRGITDTQGFQDVFSEKPHLTVTNMWKKLQNIWNINQDLKFTFTLVPWKKPSDCVYRNDILRKVNSKGKRNISG